MDRLAHVELEAEQGIPALAGTATDHLRALVVTPPCWVPPARTFTSTPSKRSLRMMLTTPAMASEPYTADAPAASTSMRSISALGMLARLTTFTEPS